MSKNKRKRVVSGREGDNFYFARRGAFGSKWGPDEKRKENNGTGRLRSFNGGPWRRRLPIKWAAVNYLLEYLGTVENPSEGGVIKFYRVGFSSEI